MTLQRKLGVAFVPVIIVVAVAVVLFALAFTRRLLSDNAFSLARETARRNASEVAGQLQAPMDTARTLAQAFSAADAIPARDRRAAASAMLRKVLEANKGFLAVWAVFEPDAFDGRDREFMGADGCSETGRFTPVWAMENGAPAISNVSENDAATEDYYQIPRRTRQETLLTPYLDAYSDKEDKILITSCIVPLVAADGSFRGVVGIDIDMTTIAAMIGAVRPYDTGYAFLIDPSGDVVAHPDSALVTKNYLETLDGSTAGALKDVFARGGEWSGTRVESGAGRSFVAVSPVKVGGATPPWSLGVSIPLGRVMSAVNRLVIALDGGMIVLLALTWVAMIVIVRILIRPLRKAVAATNRVADGDLTQRLDAEGRDEIGSLARSINGMSARLAATIGRVRESAGRVADSSRELSSTAEQLAAGTGNQAATLAET
ncbi:MAG TPA: methyl-accepting chemotaxis protein, partial [Spirochaetia bacterium]